MKKKTSVVTGAIVAAAAAVTLATPAQAGAGSAQGPNPYKPHAVCGSGYTFVKRVDIRAADVYLMWNRQKNTNCVVTLKKKDVGTPTPVTASLHRAVDGRPATRPGLGSIQRGSFKYYAGPVYVRATGALRLGNASHLETCVFWAGSTSHDVDPGAWIHCNPRPRD
ncbi:hypothetical protein [Nonomuraea turcica]|uniref:hypothetical protein n=1 Tax=Nonomuraea sp. G32 TaxID=3067274 RepID=UPI00273A7F6C|nr:hypothetical protein [Nonomuraea sp. G32]MDP4505903.1 hypothetical protein [Nonomuraea sp. G32]